MANSTFTRVTVAIVAWLLIMFGLAGVYLWQWLQTEQAVPASNRILVVEKGQGVGSVANALTQRDLLRWPLVWRLYARFLQPETLKAGEYALAAYESPITLLTRLQGGEVISYNVTFAEGLTLKQWLALLKAEPKLKQITGDMTAAQIAGELGISELNPEGWFFPDTYRFEKGDSDLDVLRRAYNKMQIELASQWARRQPSLPYDSAYEALIMASIIERETGVPYERPDIAGVFVRRLQKRMRLQTDPTVIYGMGDEYAGRIRRIHLETPTPYNTYVIKGLPPTPIANPGREAIAAAVNPADGAALYFVAKGDGSHQFSATLEQHNKAVRKYQLKRRADYSSTVKPVAPTAASSSVSAKGGK
ncbi:endolytic transglycosylase MltG [Marinagarivorans cellulosilyticus]|uniref:Endolytic murein transglycosylase n=1 Tax=Marinagarivorans cellulosilyticus TaxID=2721545 RepID=A0AAN1WFP7_9GAMM|nr:endolytic transglycosylase MltG [Marinagarivorans cellulosilyticus]BCD96756.1 hypothetical protein MARGE09_P0956 [Marinagarivorans cellulosilyticus]